MLIGELIKIGNILPNLTTAANACHMFWGEAGVLDLKIVS